MEVGESEKVTVVLDMLTLTPIKETELAIEFAWGTKNCLTSFLVPIVKGKKEYQLFREKIHLHLPYERTSNVQKSNQAFIFLLQIGGKGKLATCGVINLGRCEHSRRRKD